MGIWRSNSKEKVDDWMTLEAGLLKAQSRGGLPQFATIEWKKNGILIGKIHIQKNAHFIQLRFDEFITISGSWRSTRQNIDIESTPCHYGGNRSWFKCPNCLARVGLLARKHGPFACRKCYSLVYRSQYQTEYERLLKHQKNIKQKLFQPDEINQIAKKKKGLHWTTYYRLYEKYDRVGQDLCGHAEKILNFKI